MPEYCSQKDAAAWGLDNTNYDHQRERSQSRWTPHGCSRPTTRISWWHRAFVYKKSPPAKDKPLFVESNAHPGQLLVRLEAEYNLTLRVLLCCQIHSRGSYLIIFTCCQSPAFLIVSSWRIASWSSISFTLVIIIIDNRLFWLFETILQ